MTPAWWGALLGAVCAGGLLLVAARVRVIRRPQLAVRVLPYVRDLPQARISSVPTSTSPLRLAADLVERVLGGAATVRRRLERADIDMSVHEFRISR